jgi:HAD superfamily hydrolase (TIGR01509 family)
MTEQSPVSETSVQCIIFDFGGVIGFFDFDRTWTRLAGMTNGRFDTGQIRDAIDTSGLRDTYERGEISTSTFLTAVRERLRLTVSPRDIAEAWSEIFTPNQPVIDLIQKLQMEYRLILGSNTNELHYTQFRRQFASALDIFSEEILSYRIQVKKPDNAFYAACIQAAGCEAAACIYIDDIAEFVVSARALGIKGIVYNNTLNLAGALRAFKVQVGQ